MQWRRRWTVKVRRAVPGSWPRTETWEYGVDPAAELRRVVEQARADRRTLAWSIQPGRALVGEKPSTTAFPTWKAQPARFPSETVG